MKPFVEEFFRIVKLIETQDSFVFVRYGDGEVSLMQGKSITENTQAFVVDKWKSYGVNKLGQTLLETIKHKDWYFGIPCECCNLNCKNYLIQSIDVSENQLTYANLWVNSNYKLFLQWVQNLKIDVVLIGNENGLNNLQKFPFKVLEYFKVPNDCVNFYENNSESLITNLNELALKYNKTLFFISAGPLSEVIIHHLYNKNKINKYVDVGSSLDEFIHQKKTRPYMIEGTMYNKKICNF